MESPSEPESPETPSLVVWGRWLLHHAMQEGGVIRKAPLSFIIAVVVATAVFAWCIHWWIAGEYEHQIDDLKATNESLDATTKSLQATIEYQDKRLLSFTGGPTSVG